MESTFRASMNWLHTWAGVVFGGMLFAIFWMGTLSVFDREIDRWMAPMTRLALPADTKVSIDAFRTSYDSAAATEAPFWNVLLPTDRVPVMRLTWEEGPASIQRFVDPTTGAMLPDAGTLAGTRFLYPFHYMLHLRFERIGYWIVGLAGMAMLALCVSGVVIHRKIFADFFTFRADKKARRLVLDLHNVTGVLGLPFHVIITLSGLIIFYSLYFPSAWQVTYKGGLPAFFADAYGPLSPTRSGSHGAMASIDAMTAEARRLWDGAPLRYVTVRNPGDATSVVQIGRLDEGGVSYSYDMAFFDGPTGKLIDLRTGTPPVMSTLRFLAGLHFVQFHHWTLRWIYFALGLAGCLLIATGYLFWLESRRKRHEQLGLRGVRVVEGLTVGSVTGILIATLAFFVVNRLLPLGATFAGQDRAALEIWTFYLVWLVTFAHAWLRPGRAWLEQSWTLTGFAAAAALLNWITTGDHLICSLSHRHLWPIAGMDLLLLAGAAVAALAARKLQRGPVRRESVRAMQRFEVDRIR